jgi:hypothetical protein
VVEVLGQQRRTNGGRERPQGIQWGESQSPRDVRPVGWSEYIRNETRGIPNVGVRLRRKTDGPRIRSRKGYCVGDQLCRQYGIAQPRSRFPRREDHQGEVSGRQRGRATIKSQ